eukprot:6172578-Pleurochrysis_carterae.AAC.2
MEEKKEAEKKAQGQNSRSEHSAKKQRGQPDPGGLRGHLERDRRVDLVNVLYGIERVKQMESSLCTAPCARAPLKTTPCAALQASSRLSASALRAMHILNHKSAQTALHLSHKPDSPRCKSRDVGRMQCSLREPTTRAYMRSAYRPMHAARWCRCTQCVGAYVRNAASSPAQCTRVRARAFAYKLARGSVHASATASVAACATSCTCARAYESNESCCVEALACRCRVKGEGTADGKQRLSRPKAKTWPVRVEGKRDSGGCTHGSPF